MSVEYEALAVGGFVVAAVLIWNGIRKRKRIRRIETQLVKMQKEIKSIATTRAASSADRAKGKIHRENRAF
jgi:hypothetical protein